MWQVRNVYFCGFFWFWAISLFYGSVLKFGSHSLSLFYIRHFQLYLRIWCNLELREGVTLLEMIKLWMILEHIFGGQSSRWQGSKLQTLLSCNFEISNLVTKSIFRAFSTKNKVQPCHFKPYIEKFEICLLTGLSKYLWHSNIVIAISSSIP